VSETDIHPTAIVDPGARLGTGVRVGAYSVIGGNVEVGDGCRLQHHVTIEGPSVIGAGNLFYAYASIGQQTQDLKYVGEPTHLRIGDGNTFRECVTVHRGTAPESWTRVGSRGNFLAYSHVAHDCIVGDGVIFSNNGTIAGHVEVQDYAVIGGLTAVHQYCRIGRHAITGGCSKIVQDVPPFMIADGNPARVRGVNQIGLERHGFPEESVRRLREAYRLLYRSKMNVKQAVEEIRKTLLGAVEIEQLIEFIESSGRGIIRRPVRGGEGD
jgi:UDP-N-acetylglucosamine acyltransferase